jgi:hypothetical protein
MQNVTGVQWDPQQKMLRFRSIYDNGEVYLMSSSPEFYGDVLYNWLHRDFKPHAPEAYPQPHWPKKPDTDGSVIKGWVLTSNEIETTFGPYWIVRGK